ncbi:hypothetical protein bcere0029_56070 [Bacillus cereus AH1272]|nr:hypothetical protein bcere0029_56070 [Bacillus cereus AH1272]EEL90315.1 hypothetical protein bcere0030_57560 [Bacillus cereus AH1273]
MAWLGGVKHRGSETTEGISLLVLGLILMMSFLAYVGVPN